VPENNKYNVIAENLMAIKIVVVVVLLGCNSLVWAETWVPINKPGQLKELIGGVTVDYTHENGEKATATYNEDGEGSLTVGLAVFPRKWAIVGDDKACYNS
jgi:hypothetical protein